MLKEITEKQLKTIGYIEENLGIKFEGKNSSDARMFIMAYMEDSKRAYEKKKNEAITFIIDMMINNVNLWQDDVEKLKSYKKYFVSEGK